MQILLMLQKSQRKLDSEANCANDELLDRYKKAFAHFDKHGNKKDAGESQSLSKRQFQRYLKVCVNLCVRWLFCTLHYSSDCFTLSFFFLLLVPQCLGSSIQGYAEWSPACLEHFRAELTKSSRPSRLL